MPIPTFLLRAAHRPDPLCTRTRLALKILYRREDQICIVPQNIVEFWCAATRPTTSNGLGLSTADASRLIAWIESLLHLLPESQEIHARWTKLVAEHSVSGLQVYDARLVAAMKVHGVTSVLTFNTADFSRYPGIQVLHPDQVLAGSM